jgi:hypothetical protein
MAFGNTDSDALREGMERFYDARSQHLTEAQMLEFMSLQRQL